MLLVCNVYCLLDPVNFPSKTAPPYADGSMHYSSILISEGQSNSFVNPLSTISPVAMQCLASTDEITEMVQRTFSHSGHSDIHPVQSLTPNPVSCQIASETGVCIWHSLQSFTWHRLRWPEQKMISRARQNFLVKLGKLNAIADVCILECADWHLMHSYWVNV